MTNPTQPKPNPVPAILVYGTPSGPAFTQASWFRAEDKEAVKSAAEALKFSVIELHTDADKALAAGAHEGKQRTPPSSIAPKSCSPWGSLSSVKTSKARTFCTARRAGCSRSGGYCGPPS
jgi:hypothetical protein